MTLFDRMGAIGAMATVGIPDAVETIDIIGASARGPAWL